jgi:hypothetical protein
MIVLGVIEIVGSALSLELEKEWGNRHLALAAIGADRWAVPARRSSILTL